MPLPKSTHYGMKKTAKGMMRLAFDSKGKVIEAKNMRTKAVHTSKEFAKDRAKAKKK